ncbi:hypothetical protein [Aureibacillus halotolerans]|uniref:Uncharacterized protein n=1 Tax=Aureibacillus halotolerans TaxID=1508390 RepID=A0A4R6TSJ4_9BACI|nr:hypothetical protein [Aureibacillus halotolerans]TDQ36590.1 hypothetical protein EV213_11754 [Aureibacillus halotolerans]
MLRFIRRSKRRLKMKKVKEGDGHLLKDYRIWHMFTRSLFHIEITNSKNEKTKYAMNCKYFTEEPQVDLYRNGKHVAFSKLPAAFPIENGILEIKNGGYGINRIHYVTDEEGAFSIYPDKRSIRGLRMRLHKQFPTISSLIEKLAVVILLTSIALSFPQLVEKLTEVPWVTENVGAFHSPFAFPLTVNLGIIGIGMLAGYERTLMLRSHWLIDMETNTWNQ